MQWRNKIWMMAVIFRDRWGKGSSFFWIYYKNVYRGPWTLQRNINDCPEGPTTKDNINGLYETKQKTRHTNIGDCVDAALQSFKEYAKNQRKIIHALVTAIRQKKT